MIKIEVDKEKFDALEARHWEWFNLRLKKEFEWKTKKGNVVYSYKKFLSDKFRRLYIDLKAIVTASFDDILKYVDENDAFFKEYKKNFNEVLKEFYKVDPEKSTDTDDKKKEKKKAEGNLIAVVQDCFGYDDFVNGNKKGLCKSFVGNENLLNWGAYQFTKEMNVNVCPYCNRHYIFTIGIDENKKDNPNYEYDKNGRPEIDHFFPKSKYPYLSCTLSNFIPSCHECNHKKSDIYNQNDPATWTLYPYLEGFGEGKNKNAAFKLRYADEKEYAEKGFEILTKIKSFRLKTKIENSNKAFHLKELYDCQQIEIEDLIKRYRNYSKPKRDEILKIILETKIGRQIRADDFQLLMQMYSKRLRSQILGLPLVDNIEYPFRKFKEDIIEQFDEADRKIKQVQGIK